MDVPEIDVDQLAELLAAGARLIDVRQPDEWEDSRVPNVPLVPLDELAGQLDEIVGGEALYVICRSGARSAHACEFLRANGIEAINVAGGTLAWIESGREVASGPA